jgi:hypothetical protein
MVQSTTAAGRAQALEQKMLATPRFRSWKIQQYTDTSCQVMVLTSWSEGVPVEWSTITTDPATRTAVLYRSHRKFRVYTRPAPCA